MQNMTRSPLLFDYTDPAVIADPYPMLRRFREEQPFYYFEPGGGYIVFRYRDVMALFREPRLITDLTLGAGFPPQLRTLFPDYVTLRENDLMFSSDEAHARIRKLINPLFGPRAVDSHRPRVTQLIHQIIDALPEQGVLNFFRDVAQKYPVRVISAMLNIPTGQEAEFLAFADAVIATAFPGLPIDEFVALMPVLSRGLALVRECIAERRKKPMEGDLLSQLISACDQDERLSDGELISLVGALLTGGSDTTVHLTTYTLMELLRHADQLALLRAEPQLGRSAFDETLRFNSFGRGPGLPRYARESFDYEGIRVERGQPIYLNMQSAFRDPEFVADPDVFDIRRRTNSSPWFGYGPHFCVGASLARMEADIAMQHFLRRYPQLELVGEPEYGNHIIFRDIVNLPVRVSTGPSTDRSGTSGAQQ
jgi:cytochrome P450